MKKNVCRFCFRDSVTFVLSFDLHILSSVNATLDEVFGVKHLFDAELLNKKFNHSVFQKIWWYASDTCNQVKVAVQPQCDGQKYGLLLSFSVKFSFSLMG